MNPSLPPSRSRRPRIALSKSLIVLLVAIALIVTETFGGALRYYLDHAGLSILMYPAKIACLGLFALELFTFKGGRAFWTLMLLLTIASALGMLHGAGPGNILFSLYMYGPFLFGMVCGTHLEHRKRTLALVVGLCLLASLGGVLLDKYTTVPWKGYSYSVGDTEVAGNLMWSADGVDRLAGFTRLSTTLAVILALYSLYLSAFIRSRLILLPLFGISMAAIWITTNKSTAVAYACTLLLMPLLRHRMTCRVLFATVVAIGIALPIIGLTMDFDPNAPAAQVGFLSSFYDRLIYTWPNLAHNQWVQGWQLWGAGFGMVGSTVAAFPVYSATVSMVADNSAMYLWATFGLGGLAVYCLLVPLMSLLRDKPTRLARALVCICFCLTLISWTTDVPEVSVADLFLGLAVSVALRRKAMPLTDSVSLRATIPRSPAFVTPLRTQ